MGLHRRKDNLYLVSDECPKKGEWCLNLESLQEPFKFTPSWHILDFSVFKTIIATDNEKLNLPNLPK
jgi:hypothetical protein